MLKRIQASIGRLIYEEDGPTAVEYAVMVSLIVAVCVGSVRSMSIAARSSFDSSAQSIGNAMNP